MHATGPVRTTGERSSSSIRVASVPSGHVYVRHLSDPREDGIVVRLPDIAQPGDDSDPGRWWPPAMLDADWIAANHGSFDVFHVHFGFDAKSPRELRAIGAALSAAEVPLVLTVHDLRNPHHPDADLHDAQLTVLLEHAAAVITLTRGAAEVIASRWGRVAEVLRHPHVVDWDTMSRARPAHDGYVVGLHAKSLRTNMDVAAVAPVLAATVAGLPGARLRIDIHHEVFDPGARAYAPDVGEALRALARASDRVELREHDYFSDEELWEYLNAIDVSVLPYRFGTHSGWLEACFDLGTAVVAPSCGFYGEQQPCVIYRHDETGLDAASLARAVRTSHARRSGGRADPARRREERGALAAAHRSLYSRLLR
jgi:glycosyltransferase involved in cell wall biosynthesis